jgi:hypothetical protein
VTDSEKLQVKFAVKDVKQFDENAVKEALKKKGYTGRKLIAPGGPAPKSNEDAKTSTGTL